MDLTPSQIGKIHRLKRNGFTVQRIALDMEVKLADVRQVVQPKRAPDAYGELWTAKKTLGDALRLKDPERRLAKVRCVLANYGDVLGRQVEDAERLIEEKEGE